MVHKVIKDLRDLKDQDLRDLKDLKVIKDLMVDRSAFDRVVQAGAFISVNTGAPQDANAIPVPKADADRAFDAATCIGCGACVAACKNASAMLFVGAKVSHFMHLPQGRVERETRARNLVAAMDKEGFGNCTNQNECEAACPKEIPVRVIAEMNREFLRAKAVEEPPSGKRVGGDG
jgi:succinate dehydrogenase / fumarate reductase iron-sulfur subunit